MITNRDRDRLISRSRRKERRIRTDDAVVAVVVPEAVLIKVFSWLPVKSLLRFKCLSKRWFDVISSDPYFIDLHSQQSNSKSPSRLFSLSRNLLREFKITDPISHLLPTRFDLVCLKSYDKFYVCNPSTHESITLPQFRDSHNATFGFGYVESTNEYKIVHFIETCFPPPSSFLDSHFFHLYDPNLPKECRVFTLGMGKDSPSSYASPWAWRLVGYYPYKFEGAQFPAFITGALHWLINHPELLIQKTILAFNLESEEFRLVPPPRGFSDLIQIPKHLQLVELRGLLCLSYVENYNKMNIWMLKDYYDNESWAKEYCIDLTPWMDIHGYYNDQYYVPKDIL
ncbi:F-box protein At3g07870-like [Telopea speciosissima]|uniref:F-box protein At3g07870-like n=1 Tax=Telopea speciosissima TaxID=54955 RepID=UPI001CC70A65|nr:F-box protein At3g07870-like [Telopea speciosissima]